MLTDVQTIEEIIDYLKVRLPDNMSNALSSSEFERGRISQLYSLISEFEYMLMHDVDNEDEEL